jgi:CRISPR-associated protein Cmr5
MERGGMMQTKQQQRAAFALDSLQKECGNTIRKETATFIVGTPTMILTNGIGQTMAFLLSKKGDKEKKTYDIIKKWLCKTMKDVLGDAASDDIEFLRKFNGMSQKDYLKAQHEALRFLEWLKRYARAFQRDDTTKAADRG